MRAIDADALIGKLEAWKKEAERIGAIINYRFASAIIAQVNSEPAIEPEPHWTPCSERLPDDEQFVLATYKTTDRIHVCQYHEDGSRNQWYSLNDMCRAHNNVVIAWMPLPKPYREGQE